MVSRMTRRRRCQHSGATRLWERWAERNTYCRAGCSVGRCPSWLAGSPQLFIGMSPVGSGRYGEGARPATKQRGCGGKSRKAAKSRRGRKSVRGRRAKSPGRRTLFMKRIHRRHRRKSDERKSPPGRRQNPAVSHAPSDGDKNFGIKYRRQRTDHSLSPIHPPKHPRGMQSWSGRGSHCLFCSLQPLVRPLSRSFATTPALQRGPRSKKALDSVPKTPKKKTNVFTL